MKRTDPELVKRIAETALMAVRELDNERTDVYLDFIHSHYESNPRVLEDAMTSVLLKYQSEFARRYVLQGIAEGKAEGILEGRIQGKAEGRAEGKAEGEVKGKAEGRLEIIVGLVESRFKSLPESIQTRIRCASLVRPHALAEIVLNAQTFEEILKFL